VLKVGDKVCYVPFNGCPLEKYEDGIVKALSMFDDQVFVVYHCDDD
jgi:hypothetical protein